MATFHERLHPVKKLDYDDHDTQQSYHKSKSHCKCKSKCKREKCHKKKYTYFNCANNNWICNPCRNCQKRCDIATKSSVLSSLDRVFGYDDDCGCGQDSERLLCCKDRVCACVKPKKCCKKY